jgi:hypothetical protein
MTYRRLLAAGAVALGLSIAASAALAQPYGKGGNYSPAPQPRSQSQSQSQQDHARDMPRISGCDCKMMRGDMSMRDQCMGMGDMPHETPSKPGSPG